MPVRKLSHRLLLHLRKTQSDHGVDWEQLCVVHRPRRNLFSSYLTTRCGCACWREASATRASGSGTATNGLPTKSEKRPGDKPEILDDPRLEPATQWLRTLDWFMPEPGLWIGDANENFLGSLADAWAATPSGRGISRQPGVSPVVPLAARAQAAPRRQGQRH